MYIVSGCGKSADGKGGFAGIVIPSGRSSAQSFVQSQIEIAIWNFSVQINDSIEKNFKKESVKVVSAAQRDEIVNARDTVMKFDWPQTRKDVRFPILYTHRVP